MTKRILVAGILSTLCVGLPALAQADSSPGESAFDGTVEILGKTFCMASAPATARCDWRAQSLEARTETARGNLDSFTLFGTRFCMPGADGACDAWLGDAPPKSLKLYGVDICLGDKHPACDVTIPASQLDRRASL